MATFLRAHIRLLQLPCQPCRTFFTSSTACDLRDFVDFDTRSGQQPTFGRAWRAEELRLKSWDDLHKLWYVCLKERNMLKTEIAFNKAEEKKLPHPQRYKSVKLTMNRIKQVLSERARAEEDPAVQEGLKKVIHNL